MEILEYQCRIAGLNGTSLVPPHLPMGRAEINVRIHNNDSPPLHSCEFGDPAIPSGALPLAGALTRS